MSKEIKLIWDFRGADAKEIAAHHAIHLKEYAAKNLANTKPIDSETLSPMHSIAFIVVDETDMIAVRDALKPHRGEFVNQND
ncbi:hypothetical protein [Flavimarina sp. Hel_I_48]|uniref:hypothetical protein n=1 Tax=Flavimarina sp. Hel_I_48 TaxID=1392488 RepID=UPI0004DFCCC2|nr:hypothetical protein [Flavimarina sp. Hel_I_48]